MARFFRRPRISAILILLGVKVTCFLQGLHISSGRSLGIRLRQAAQAQDAQLVTYNFDALSVPEQLLQRHVSSLARELQVAEKLQVSPESLDEYLGICLKSMPGNPYHGPAHMLDVLQFLTTLLQETGLDQTLSPVQSSALVLAAAAHDVDHTGTSNPYLVKVSHEYVEDSADGIGPMESHSASKALDLIQEIMGSKDSKLLQMVEKAIHGTDLSQHERLMKAFSAATEAASKASDLEVFFQAGTEQSILLIQMLLKAADVSNPTRPIRTARAWNCQVYEEFYAEGDQVLSSGGMPNPLHDRRTNCIPKSSVGFINFHVKSIFLGLRNFLLRCRDAGIPIRPEGVETILTRLDENAAAFAQEAAQLEAGVKSMQA